MLARRWRFGILMVLLAAGSGLYVQFIYEHWQDWRAHNPRLEHEQVLGDLVLPAGTRVHLQNLEPFNDLSGDPVPFGMQSLEQADFERAPGHILGMPVRRLELAQGHGCATVETLSAHDLAGWKCEPGEVEFGFPFGAHLQVVPGGADLIGGTRLEYHEERILHQVRGIAVVAHTLAQPAEQPRAVFDVERADGGRNRRVGRHGGYLK